MKRLRILIAAAAVAAVGVFLVAQALAATTLWSGAGTNDPVFKVSFKKVKVSGHPTKVEDFASKNLHYTCTANTGLPPFRASTTIHTPITVHSGSFFRTGSFNSGTIKVSYTISGQFVSKRTAKGTYKERRSRLSDPTQHCDSLKEPWKAHKQ